MKETRAAKDCLTSALTLLMRTNVMTVEEIDQATDKGYNGLQELLNDKYIEMVKDGRVDV